MKKLLTFVLVSLIGFSLFASIDFSEIDEMNAKGLDPKQVYDTLSKMLPGCSNGFDRSEVLWRLSRSCYSMVEKLPEKDDEGREKLFREGLDYAQRSLEENQSIDGYLWKWYSDLGLVAQTKGIIAIAKTADDIEDEILMCIDEMGCTDRTEIWTILSMIYAYYPTKSKDVAISFARAAASTVPEDRIYAIVYQQLAQLLYDRNLSAKKRVKEFEKYEKSWNKAKSLSDKYKYCECRPDINHPWTSSDLVSLSDREEAILILKYAQKKYETCSLKKESDDAMYKTIEELIEKWTK